MRVKLLPMDTHEELMAESYSLMLIHDVHGVNMVGTLTSSTGLVRAVDPSYSVCQVSRVDVVQVSDARRLSGPVVSLKLDVDGLWEAEAVLERFLELVGPPLSCLQVTLLRVWTITDISGSRWQASSTQVSFGCMKANFCARSYQNTKRDGWLQRQTFFACLLLCINSNGSERISMSLVYQELPEVSELQLKPQKRCRAHEISTCDWCCSWCSTGCCRLWTGRRASPNRLR
jgi:hypothetical protein